MTQQQPDRPAAAAQDQQAASHYARKARDQHTGREWDDELEAELAKGWEDGRGSSQLDWQSARTAVRDAWNSVERAMPDEPDGAAAQAAEDAAKDDDNQPG